MKAILAITAAIAAAAAVPAQSAPITAKYYSSFNDSFSGITFSGDPFFVETLDDIDINFAQSTGPAGRPNAGDVFGADFTGQFLIPADGSYNFSLASDDAGYLFIDGVAVVSRPGANAFSTSTGSVALTGGLHSFEVQYDNLFCCDAQIGVSFDPAAVIVTPSAVPEPASWALMIGGVALAGGALRRAYRRSEDEFTAKVREAAHA